MHLAVSQIIDLIFHLKEVSSMNSTTASLHVVSSFRRLKQVIVSGGRRWPYRLSLLTSP